MLSILSFLLRSIIASILLVFVSTQMSHQLPILSKLAHSPFKSQPENAPTTNIPRSLQDSDLESRTSNSDFYESQKSNRMIVDNYTQTSLNRSSRQELDQQPHINSNSNISYNQPDSAGLIPIVQIGSNNDNIPASRIIVCNDGPKILLFANGDIVTCYPSSQWQDKLWSDIKPSAYYYPFILANIIIFVIGTTGNVFVCLSVYRNHTLRNVTNYFIVNLALADFLVILICLPPTVIWDLTLTWFFGTFACKMVMYLQDVSVSVSVLTLTAISIDRYYAICYPLRFKSNLTKAKKIIVVIWLISFLIMSPDLIYLTTRQSKELYESGLDTVLYSDCNYNWSLQSSRIFQFEKTILLYFIPFLLMVVAHYNINKVLKVAQPNEMISIPDRGKQHRSSFTKNYHYNSTNNNDNKSQHHQPIDHLSEEEDNNNGLRKKFMNKTSAINHKELSSCKSAIPVLCVEDNSGDTIDERNQQKTPLLVQSENELNHHRHDSGSSMVQINCSINSEYNLSANSTIVDPTKRHDDTSPSQVKLNCVQKATNCNRLRNTDHNVIKQQCCGQESGTQRNVHGNNDGCSGNGPNVNKGCTGPITLRQQRNHSTMSNNTKHSIIIDPSPSADRNKIDSINSYQESSHFHQKINSHSKTEGNCLVSDPNVPADQIAFIDKADHNNYDDDNNDDYAGQVSRHLLLSMDGKKEEMIASGETRTIDHCCSYALSIRSNIGTRCDKSGQRFASKDAKENEDKPIESSKKTQIRLLNPTTNGRMIHENANDNDDEYGLAASEYQIIGEHSRDRTVNSGAIYETNDIENNRNTELVCINQLVCSNCLVAPMARSNESEINDAPNSITIGFNSPLQPTSSANKNSASSLGSSSSCDTIKLNSTNEKIKRKESSHSSKSILCCSGFCRSCSKSISQTPSIVNARTMNNGKSYVNNKSGQRSQQAVTAPHPTNCDPSVDAVFCNDNRTIINKGDTSCREAAFSSLSASSGETSLSTADTDDNGVNQLADKNVTAAHLLLNDDDIGAGPRANSITGQSRILPERTTCRQHQNQLTGGSTMSIPVINSGMTNPSIERPAACNLPMAGRLHREQNSLANADSSNLAILFQTMKGRANVSGDHDLERGGPTRSSNLCTADRCSITKGIWPCDSENTSVHQRRLPASHSGNRNVDLNESIFKYCLKRSQDEHGPDSDIIGISNGSSLQIIVNDEENDREKIDAPLTDLVSSSDPNDENLTEISTQEVDSNHAKENPSKQFFNHHRGSVSGLEPCELIRVNQPRNMPKKPSDKPVKTENSCIYDDDIEASNQDEHKIDVDDSVVRHEKSPCTMTIRQANKSSTINPNYPQSSPYDVPRSRDTNFSTKKLVDLNNHNNIWIRSKDEKNFSTSCNHHIDGSFPKHGLCDRAINPTPQGDANIQCSSLKQQDQPINNIGWNLGSEQHDNGYNCHEAYPNRKLGKKPEKIVELSLVARASTSEEDISSCKGDISENQRRAQSNEKLTAQELATRSLCDLKSRDKPVTQASDCHSSNSTSVVIPGLLRPDSLADNLNRDNDGKVVKSHHRSNSIATTILTVDKATDTTAFLGTSNTGSILASMVPSINMHNKSKIQSRQKAAKMLMAIVIIFGVCFLPVHLINFLRHIVDDIPQTEITSTISMLSHCFCYLNSAINPIIYNYMNSVFRQEFKKFLSCLWCSSKNKSTRATRPTNMKTREYVKTGPTTKDSRLANQNPKPIQASPGNHARQLPYLTKNFHDDSCNDRIQALTSTTSAKSCLDNRKNTDCTTLSADMSEISKAKSMEVR